jgi:adenylosuccinate synthase
MTQKVYCVTDLGPGDGGKGGVNHKLACLLKPHHFLLDGAACGSHGAKSSRGFGCNFSQWSSGTLEGIKTFLTARFVANPLDLFVEAKEIRFQAGIPEPWKLLKIDERVLCATPWHGIASRLKELARGKKPRGTVGTGVGEAYRYAERLPDLAVYAGNLGDRNLRERLATIRNQIIYDLEATLQSKFLPEDQTEAHHELALLADERLLDYTVEKFNESSRLATIVPHDYLGQVILPRNGTVVVERSHGILTDRYAGFHPHTSARRTLPQLTTDLLRAAGYSGQIINLGVTRAYAVRHGAGPMPTADEGMSEKLLPGSHKQENRYQGKIRVGALDLPLLRYAIAASGPTTFDGLAITWFDQIRANSEWHLCHRYQSGTDETYFTSTGDPKVQHGEDIAQLAYQEALGQSLAQCTPDIETQRLNPNESNEQLFDRCASTLRETLGVPVRMVSFGPTELDKICK